ncbi:MAG TPA: class I SAM-dependent methyltransferase [Novimethylophilus sp.]|jgi:SAM-dependent methyltransferase|uniref:class I SAM-dependent methyltransferase n=1 Tax=Novimethylophilus sp. TaxID=2137426 RepID=UPI002F42BA40
MTLPLHHRRKDCRLCGSDELSLALPLPATPAGDHFVPKIRLDVPQPVFPMDVYLCRDCGLAQLLDVVDPGFLYGEYLYRTSISLGLAEHFRRYAAAVIDSIQPPPDALVVDIGSNDGTLLKFFRDSGCQVLGVDPAVSLAEEATRSGIPTLARFFDLATAQAICAAHGQAQIITANNVFANIDDLDSFIAGVTMLLAPGGAFVFETGYWPDLVNNRVIDNIYHEHLSYFSVAPLDKFFRRHGLALVEIQHSASKGGSIRGIVRWLKDGASPSSTVQAFLSQEEAFGLKNPASYQPLIQLLDHLRERFSALTKKCETQHLTLAGYGASVGVTTLIYALELGDKLQFLVDDNPIKHNLHSPGNHIPVLPSEMLYEKNPDYVILFPWRYAAPITARHPGFKAQGGKFVLPLPDFRIEQ